MVTNGQKLAVYNGPFSSRSRPPTIAKSLHSAEVVAPRLSIPRWQDTSYRRYPCQQ
jgi:hypothetical protein